MNVVDPARSAQMALIRHKDTKPELRVRKALHAAGLRYRLHDQRLPGRPDITFPSRKVAVFVHGCFFHQHPGCSRARMPKSRREFWEPKLQGNAQRDRRTRMKLQDEGWTVFVIWECETERSEHVDQLRSHIMSVSPFRVPQSLSTPRPSWPASQPSS
jgi:DNA mismatch endonuclease, patch repair protein